MNRLARLLLQSNIEEGENATELPFLSIWKTKKDRITMPDGKTPYIYIVANGSMRLHTHNGIMDYLPGQYSVSAIDTPIFGQVFSDGISGEFLAVIIRFTYNDAISVLMDIDGDLVARIMKSGLSTATMDSFDKKVMKDAERLFPMLGSKEQMAFSAKMVRKELIFDVLCGSCGKQFLQSITGIQQAGEIYEINTWIKENFRESFSVEELAERGNMSISNFHQKFKSAVGMGPLQCQKRLRLTEARRKMLDENVSVTEAAIEVGYESVSQFNRDYKKMFRTPPTKDIMRLREQSKI